MQLGELKKVKDLRSVWKHEAADFSRWLAKEENLNKLGDEIGIDMELRSIESKTGSFSTDILAVEVNTDNRIIIENQLEQTNHDHLGKIITYASGQDAKTIIWVVKEAREEHRQAIDWLNEHTDEEINIFLCKIELWKIDDSAIAPKFQIVSSPNNWTKTIKRGLNNELTSTKTLQYHYWAKLSEEIDNNYPKFNSRKPNGQHWYNLAIGTSLANISLTINTQKDEIKSSIEIKNNKELFDYLFSEKEEIETIINEKLKWRRLDNKKASFIEISSDFDINDENNWSNAIKWHLNMASKLYDTFADRIKEYY